MKRNPLVPFALIAILGIGLIFLFSFKGLADNKKLAGKEEKPKTTDIANASPDEIYKQNCLQCHGDKYQGGVGPKLAGIKASPDEIKNQIKNGGGGMPAGLVPPEKLDAMTKWVSNLK
ncbi:cytochrome c550 [Metabacillus sp. RGM 3146]|uniref:cytochrome c550 n=1 Tax=Metabacillus sp. RGM 3146 TaxID=3401092 RepID=UPI003B9C1338